VERQHLVPSCSVIGSIFVAAEFRIELPQPRLNDRKTLFHIHDQ
jgi:hypothetical protein